MIKFPTHIYYMENKVFVKVNTFRSGQIGSYRLPLCAIYLEASGERLDGVFPPQYVVVNIFGEFFDTAVECRHPGSLFGQERTGRARDLLQKPVYTIEVMQSFGKWKFNSNLRKIITSTNIIRD